MGQFFRRNSFIRTHSSHSIWLMLCLRMFTLVLFRKIIFVIVDIEKRSAFEWEPWLGGPGEARGWAVGHRRGVLCGLRVNTLKGGNLCGHCSQTCTDTWRPLTLSPWWKENIVITISLTVIITDLKSLSQNTRASFSSHIAMGIMISAMTIPSGTDGNPKT